MPDPTTTPTPPAEPPPPVLPGPVAPEVLDKPESSWTKGQWKAEVYKLREQLDAATAFSMTAPAPIVVDDAQAAEKIRQLERRVHHLSSGKPGRQLDAVRSALAKLDAPIDRAGVLGLLDLVR